MFIYGMYRLDHKSLTIQPPRFVTSVVDMMRYTVQGFNKQGKNSANWNT